MTTEKFTLISTALLLTAIMTVMALLMLMLPAQGQQQSPPECLDAIIATEPPQCVAVKKQLPSSKMPMEYQLQHLKQYDHDYDGELIVLRASEPWVRKACYQQMKPGHLAIGCAFQIEPKKCRILIVTDDVLKLTGWDYDIVFRHERGHCNGGVHDDNGKWK